MFDSSTTDNNQYRAKRIIAVLLVVFIGWVPASGWGESKTGSTLAQTKKQSSQTLEEKETKLRDVLKEAEVAYGPSSKQVYDELQKLAQHLYQDDKRKKEVFLIIKRMVFIARELYGEGHPVLAETLAGYGLMLANEKQDVEAERILKEAIVNHKIMGKTKTDLYWSIAHTLGVIYNRTNQSDKSIHILKESLLIAEGLYGVEHVKLLVSLESLGSVTKKGKRYDDALYYFNRALHIREKYYGKNDSRILNVLGELASIYSLKEKYEQAVNFYQRSLAVRETTSASELDIATNSYWLAYNYMKLGKPAQALPLFKRCLKIREAKLPSDHPDNAAALFSLAEYYHVMGKYDDALALYERSVVISNKILPEKHIRKAQNLLNLANLYKRMGKYDKALSLFKESLAMYEDLLGYDHPILAGNLRHLANLYLKMGLLKEALPAIERSLEIYERTEPLDYSGIYLAINTLGDVYKNQGRFEVALIQYKKAVDLFTKKYGYGHPKNVLGLHNLGELYMSMGRYDQSLPILKLVKKINEKQLPKEHPNIATDLSTLALFYLHLGQYDKALELYNHSHAIRVRGLPKYHPDIATSLNNIAVTYLEMRKPEKALPLLERSLEIREKLLPASHPDIALAVHNLAGVYMNTKRFSKAKQLFIRSLSMRRVELSDYHPKVGTSHAALGYCLLELNEHEDAKDNLQKAISISQLNNARETLWYAQKALSELFLRLKNIDLSIIWGKEAVNTLQNLRTDLKGVNADLQSSFISKKSYVYHNLADLLITAGRVSEAQAVLQMLKEVELYDSLQRSSNTDPRNTRVELTGLEQKQFARYDVLQDQQVKLGKELEQLEQKKKAGLITTQERQRLTDIKENLIPPLHEAMLVFLKKLQKQSEQYTKDKAYRQGELKLVQVETNLQKALIEVKRSDPDARIAALQYVITDNRLSILLSTPNNPPLARQIKYDGKDLRNQIFTVRELLSDPKSDRDILKKHLLELHGKLIAPIAEDLKTLEVKTLVLVPNDVLRYVPFAALFDGKRYLVQDYTLTLFNEAVKKDFLKSVQGKWQLAAMGLSQAVEHLPALSNVPDELNAVATKSGLKGITYLDDAFTRVVLKDSLNQEYNVLHLASHFEFVAGRPDASRFFLGDRSSLYLGDIARENMRFDKFSLVTFSACETGLGGGLDADGRDMESLGALVQNQGASAVMATLWKVEDSSTATLMETFYRVRHEDKLHKAEALRKAQLKFIKRGGGRSVLAHPYYWAPFVLMGDWR